MCVTELPRGRVGCRLGATPLLPRLGDGQRHVAVKTGAHQQRTGSPRISRWVARVSEQRRTGRARHLPVGKPNRNPPGVPRAAGRRWRRRPAARPNDESEAELAGTTQRRRRRRPAGTAAKRRRARAAPGRCGDAVADVPGALLGGTSGRCSRRVRNGGCSARRTSHVRFISYKCTYELVRDTLPLAPFRCEEHLHESSLNFTSGPKFDRRLAYSYFSAITRNYIIYITNCLGQQALL